MRAYLVWWCYAILLASFVTVGLPSSAQCPHELNDPSYGRPAVSNLSEWAAYISGKVAPMPLNGTVRLCAVRGEGPANVVAAQPVTAAGDFSILPPAPLQAGDKISVQVVVDGQPATYGPDSEIVVVKASCKHGANVVPGQAPPTISITKDSSGKPVVKGTGPKTGNLTVRVCINDAPATVAPVPIQSDGTWTIIGVDLKDKDEVTAQLISNVTGGKKQYGAISASASLPSTSGPAQPAGLRYILIGGVEQSGYSSLAQSTEPFIQFLFNGPPHRNFAPWGKARLLGSPQPSTNGIAATFTDPTGTITKLDFTKVGQSVDVALGGEKYLIGESATHGRASAIAWVGATTPLSSQDVTLMFKVPDVSTRECAELLKRFTPQLGYNPGLTGDPTGKTCVLNGGTAVTDIAFANQDRSNFFFKWGAGVRLVGTENCTAASGCLNALNVLDLTIGQDATVTRGIVRNLVFKADGILALPTGEASYLYLFGSAYLRLKRNAILPPLILASETNKPSLPSAAVVVLPLQQPDRDFFRLGIGLNLSQIFCKVVQSKCSNDSMAAGTAK